ncbi:hypothetical protein N0V82_003718 [Gnomoniopsis sp. IMI 355080]|nr:hypothetical protein N0V82_003718 [Gnomoniopsis sp. IMI 355080]
MAPMKTLNSNYSSSNHGENIARQANVLASCYIVDAAASLKGFHYCTTLAGPSGIPEVPISGLPSPPSSPPLAAITSSNELALTPKPKRYTNGNGSSSASRTRRGGATLRIREECERLFCETMRAVFQGERNSVNHVSGLAGVYQHHQSPNRIHNQQQDDESDISSTTSSIDSGYFGSYTGDSQHRPEVRQQLTPPYDGPTERMGVTMPLLSTGIEATAWMEIWDYQGGASFLAFMAEDMTSGEKSLFTFFDAGVVGHDLKKALVAMIELAEIPLGCSRLVVCVDRSIETEDLQPLTKGLQWAGFELETLEHWTGLRDLTSEKWLFMGVEV